MDPKGHASIGLHMRVTPTALTMQAGYNVVIRRTDVLEVRLRRPRIWEAPPFGLVLAVRTTDAPRRWRRLYWSAYYAPNRLVRTTLTANGWLP
jgi:hypothetical protein